VGKTYSAPGRGVFAPARRIRALDGVSLTVGTGESLGIVGESGSGKSTLARAVLALEGGFEGEVLVEGLDAKARTDFRRRVQIVFQDPSSALNPRRRVGWILEEPLRIHRIGGREERARAANEMLETVGLDSSYRRRFPSELSGGQRQRIVIAAALMLGPDLVVADEPVSALDVSVQAQILNLLRDLRERLGLSYLFISHNLDVVHYICDRVAVMYRGRIVEEGPVEEVYDRPLHPYTAALLDALPGSADPARRGTGRGAIARPPGTSDEESDEEAAAGCPYRRRCGRAAMLGKLADRCAAESPGLEGSGGRRARCHFMLEGGAA
jgi:oligopeptide transport system ATP-binding protein